MQNPNDLRDEPKEVIKKTQKQTAIATLCNADLRRKLVRENAIDTSFTIADALGEE